jgi:choline dehydrogenase
MCVSGFDANEWKEEFRNDMKTDSRREMSMNPRQNSRASASAVDSLTEFSRGVAVNQSELRSDLKAQYDFIVCGSGSSGSVVAGRLAADSNVSVLLLEAGGDDDVPEVMEGGRWPMNLGSERDWSFQSQPNEELNGRAIHLAMGKVLGGGSSINVMAWARGHQSDWDYFASESGDSASGYESILKTYGAIEDWHGAPDPKYRGTGGPVFVEPAPNPNLQT